MIYVNWFIQLCDFLQLQSIASLTMKEVDFDQDGTISFDDFQQVYIYIYIYIVLL